MPRFKFVARAVDEQDPLPGSGVDKGQKEIVVGTLDIEDKTVIPLLAVLKTECPKGTSIEAWLKDESGYWTLVAKK